MMLNTVSMYIQLPLEHEHDISGREGVTNDALALTCLVIDHQL